MDKRSKEYRKHNTENFAIFKSIYYMGFVCDIYAFTILLLNVLYFKSGFKTSKILIDYLTHLHAPFTAIRSFEIIIQVVGIEKGLPKKSKLSIIIPCVSAIIGWSLIGYLVFYRQAFKPKSGGIIVESLEGKVKSEYTTIYFIKIVELVETFSLLSISNRMNLLTVDNVALLSVCSLFILNGCFFIFGKKCEQVFNVDFYNSFFIMLLLLVSIMRDKIMSYGLYEKFNIRNRILGAMLVVIVILIIADKRKHIVDLTGAYIDEFVTPKEAKDKPAETIASLFKPITMR